MKIVGLKKIIPIRVLTREICPFEIYMFFQDFFFFCMTNLAEKISFDRVLRLKPYQFHWKEDISGYHRPKFQTRRG
jgi:hypothetical protein